MSHRKGPIHPRVTVVEYFDFQCPYCAEAEKPLKEVLDVFGDDTALVVRQFPRSDIHEFAEIAALASEAAGLQDKFWEMHDLIFANQDDLTTETVVACAGELGLDMEKFGTDIQSGECRKRVNRDIEEGEKLGVDSTPTVFVNGEVLEGGATFEALSRAVAGILGKEAA